MEHFHRIRVALRAAALLAMVAALICCPSCKRSSAPAKVRIGQGEWRVELAVTEAQRRRGLGGRKAVPEGTGMLFVLDREAGGVPFHMKDCLVPLDVAFISASLVVVDIRTMSVEPDPSDPQILYLSEHPYRYALEVAAGELERAGVEIGDRVALLGGARDAAKASR